MRKPCWKSVKIPRPPCCGAALSSVCRARPPERLLAISARICTMGRKSTSRRIWGRISLPWPTRRFPQRMTARSFCGSPSVFRRRPLVLRRPRAWFAVPLLPYRVKSDERRRYGKRETSSDLPVQPALRAIIYRPGITSARHPECSPLDWLDPKWIKNTITDRQCRRGGTLKRISKKRGFGEEEFF